MIVNKFISIILTAIAAAIWFVVIWIVWLAMFDSNHLEIKESGAWNVDGRPQKEFRAGDRFLAHRIICTSKASPGDFTIEIHGKTNGIVLQVSQGRLGQVDGCTTRNIMTAIPDTLPVGEYRLRAYTVYEINALRTLRYELPPIEFSVVP